MNSGIGNLDLPEKLDYSFPLWHQLILNSCSSMPHCSLLNDIVHSIDNPSKLLRFERRLRTYQVECRMGTLINRGI